MNDGLNLIDIVFFAMVAAFLVLRLRSVLGRRTGNERPPHDVAGGVRGGQDNVIDLGSARKTVAEPLPEGPAREGLMEIREADPAFSPSEFLTGARAAFAMIVEAFAAGEKPTLKPLLSDEVFHGFAQAIDARSRAGETLETELISVRAADIIEARMEGRTAHVTVRFKSEQVNLVKDLEGRIVEGDPERVTDVIDEWTFARDTSSDNPNWKLVATRSPEETD